MFKCQASHSRPSRVGADQANWRFPKIEVPQIIHFHRNHCKPSILGYQHLWKPPLVMVLSGAFFVICSSHLAFSPSEAHGTRAQHEQRSNSQSTCKRLGLNGPASSWIRESERKRTTEEDKREGFATSKTK